MKVLIVDDDYISRTKMETIFEDLGECIAVEDGYAAIAVFNSELDNAPFDLIALDIAMPEMDGTEVLNRIRKTEKEKKIDESSQVKIIMVTSHSDIDNIMSCMKAGCTDYIVKPFNLQTIMKKLNDIGLSNSPMPSPEPEPVPRPTQDDQKNSEGSNVPPRFDTLKTLVVDDDFISRTKMETILAELGECKSVDNGREAVELFETAINSNSPYDLITLDITMPDMDGTEVLFTIRDFENMKNIPLENQVKVLMVTSHADKDNYITCHQAGCNDYIVKPFDAKSINHKIEEIQSKSHFVFSENKISQAAQNVPTTSSIIADISAALQKEEINLPVLPETGIKFKKLMEKGAGIDDVEDLLKKDLGITSKLIAISNTAFYKGVTKNETLVQAITRLGLDTTQQIVEAISNRSLYGHANNEYKLYVEKLWKHSISCAYAAEFISERLKIEMKANPFTLGLLHDIGKVILLQIIDELDKRGTFGDALDKEIIFETLNKFHCQFGASLLQRWEFAKIYETVALHHGNISSPPPLSNELLIVHFANLLVNYLEEKGASANPSELTTSKSAELLGLTTEMVKEITDKVLTYSATEF